jgi:3-oxoacid CoA-transferase subunit B
MTWTKEQMADEIVQLIAPNSTVNLGIGLPTLVAERVSPELNLVIHSENGVLGVKGRPTKQTVSATLINAGKETISVSKGASFFDSATSFGMIRGGHIDYCVLGGMEVDVEANLANWAVPGKKLTGMGGAMDLVNGAKKVFIMMNHFSKDGEAKLVKRCSLPLTGLAVVDLVVTECALLKPNGKSFDIIKLAPGVQESDLKLPI